jgi:hypothetical protein
MENPAEAVSAAGAASFFVFRLELNAACGQ